MTFALRLAAIVLGAFLAGLLVLPYVFLAEPCRPADDLFIGQSWRVAGCP